MGKKREKKVHFDRDEVLRHLRLLRHDGVGVTQISISRRFATDEEEETARKNWSPSFWIGVFSPSNYEELIQKLHRFYRYHPAINFNVYVGSNPREEEALRYADHEFLPIYEIAKKRLSPQQINKTLV